MNHEDRILNEEDRFAVDYRRTPMTSREKNDSTRKADELMTQYIRELVDEGALSEVRPDNDLVTDDLRSQLYSELETGIDEEIKQRISNLYDDETGPQSLRIEGAKTEEWKERLYDRTLNEISDEAFTAG
jgi:polyhydroxyalkanoate synthesis regulator phasin